MKGFFKEFFQALLIKDSQPINSKKKVLAKLFASTLGISHKMGTTAHLQPQ